MRIKTAGMALIIMTISMIAYMRFNFITTGKEVTSSVAIGSFGAAGPVTINPGENHTVQWSPIIRVALLVGGILIIIRKRASI